MKKLQIQKLKYSNLKIRFTQIILLISLIFLYSVSSVSAQRTASVNGDWSNSATWGGEAIPVSTDIVTINSGIIVNVDIAAVAASITVNSSATANGIIINGTNTLTVSNGITMNSPSAGAVSSTIDVGTGTLNAGSVTIPGSATPDAICIISVSTGTITTTGNITLSGTPAQARLTFSGNGTLNIGGNWNNGGTFSAGTGSVTFNGASAQTIGGTSETAFNNLLIDNVSGVSLKNNQTIEGTLTLTSGKLILDTYNLMLGSAAVAGTLNASNMIVATSSGQCRRAFTSNGSYTFPVGDADGTPQYSPISLNFVSGTYSGAYAGIRVTNAKHPNNASSTNYLNRYWTVTSTGIGSFSCNVTGTYTPADIVGTEGGQITAKYNGSLPWVKYSLLASNTLTANNVTSFSDFTGITSALPTVSIAANPASTVCQNASLSLTANPTGDPSFTYAWLPNGETTQSITAPTSSTGPVLYTVTATDGNGITAVNNVTVTVNQLPSNKTVAAASASVCSGTGTDITVSSTVAGIFYQLRNDADNSSIGTSQEGNGGTLTFATGALTVATTFNVLATLGSCSLQMSDVPTVALNVLPTPVISGQATVCSGETGSVYSAANVSGHTYVWTVEGGTITAGQNTNSVTVTWGATGAGTVDVTETITATSCSAAATQKAVTINPLPTPVITGSATVCSGVTGSVYGTTNVSGHTYLWTVGGGTITAGQNTNSVTVTWGTAGAGTVDVTETITATSCSAAATQKAVTISPLPTPVITGSATVCSGVTGSVYTTTNISGHTYLWTVGGGTITAGQNTNSVTVTWGTAGAGTVNVTETITATTCSAAATQKAVTIDPLPAPVITGSATVCSGVTGSVYTTTNVSGHTYLWTVGGGTITAGQSTNSVTVTWGTAGAGTVNVTETITATTCSAAATQKAVTINVLPAANAITGAATLCAGSSGVAYAVTTDNTPTATYFWSYSGTGATLSAATGKNISIDFNNNATSGTLTVIETISATGCSTSNNRALIVNPLPTISVTSSAACSADLLTYTVGVTVSTGILTSTSGTVTNTSGNVWSVSAVPSGTNITLTVTDANSCLKTLSVTAPDCSCGVIAAPVSGGNREYCSGSSIPAITASVLTGETVDWYGDASGGIALLTGNTSFTPTSAGTYYAEARNTTTNCKSSTRTAISVTVNALPTPVITGSGTVCSGVTGTVYSTTGISGHTYSWNVVGGTITSGQNTNSISVTWGVSGSGTVDVTETITATGCFKSATQKPVTINALPTPVITGSATVCTGITGSVYSTTNVSNHTYSWSVGGGTITAGQNTNSITVTWGVSGGGTVDVTETITATGCSKPATQKPVTINALPTPVIGGSATTCSGVTGSVYTTPNVSGHTYSWVVVGGTITSGQNTNSITVTWGAAGAGTVDITETITATGCSKSASQKPVTINALPTPVITGSSATCTGITGSVYSTTDISGHTYSWAVSGGTITAGQNTNSITVTWGAAGAGTVNVTESITATACSAIAAPKAVTINSLPAPVISGSSTVCSGVTGTVYSAANVSGHTYSWAVAGGNITAGQNTNAITVAWGPAGAGTVDVTESISATGCSKSAVQKSVTVNPSPTISVSAPATCAPNLLSYSIAVTVSSGTITSTSGTVVNTSGNLWTINEVPAGTNITLTATDGNGCLKTLSITAPNCSCNVIAAPVSGGNKKYCSGSSIPAITAIASTGETVDWYAAQTGGVALASGVTGYTPPSPGTYYAEARNTTTNCKSSTRTAITVTVNPPPAAVAGVSGSICLNSSTSLGAAAVAGSTYNWSSVPVGFTSSVANPSVTPSVTTTYKLVETITSTGCSNTHSVVVTVNPLPAAVAGSGRSICMNSSTTLGAQSISGRTYSWSSVPAGFSSAISNPTVSPSVTSTYALTETINATGCKNAHNVVVTVNPLPTIVVTMPAVCAVNLLTYHVVVTVSSGTVTSSSGTVVNNNDNVWTISEVPTGTNITLTVTDANSCLKTLSITSPDCSCNAVAVPVSGGNKKYCSGNQIPAISASVPAGETVDWYAAPTGGVALASGVIDYTPLSAGTYYAEARNTTTNCKSSTRTAVKLTMNPLPVAFTGAGRVICPGMGTILGAAADTGRIYRWSSVPAGFASTIANPTVNPLVTTTYTLAETFTYTGCTNSHSVLVTVNPVPAAIAGANRAICLNSNAILGAAPVAGSTYSWSSAPAGFTSSLANPTVTPAVTTTYTVTETITATGCTNTHNVLVTVNPLPVPTILGPATACAGAAGITYSTEASMTGYVWTVSPGGNITAGATSNTITLNWNTEGTKNLTVNYINPGGCSGAAATIKNVSVIQAPGNAGNIIGTTTICGGLQGVAYSTTAISNAASYVWSLPSGATISGGDGTRSIKVNFAGSASSGNISVYGNNACSNGKASSIGILVTPRPEGAGVITGPATFGRGTTGAVYSVEPIANAAYYTWSLPAGASIISGDSTNVVSVNFSENAEVGNITVFGSNSCANGPASPALALTIPESQSSVYPVPNNGIFNILITSPVETSFSIKVFNHLGDKIMEITDASTASGKYLKSIDLRPIPSGIYYVEFLNGQSRVIRKVIINK